MHTLLKKITLSVASLILLVAGSVTNAQDDHPAQVIVKDVVTDMLTFLSDNHDAIMKDPSLLYNHIEGVINPHVDFETMTRLAVGRSWRDADATQQTELVQEFEKLLLNTYSSALTQYSGEEIEFERFRPENRDDRAEVRTLFKPKAGSSVPATYKLREKDGWKIYDIDVSGLSLVGNFRTRFAEEIDSGGIAGLLNFLKQRNG